MKIHFIAIGGSAMHNLAIALHKKGFQITGSDDQIFDPSKSRLEKYGLLPKSIGWNASNITEDLDAVILGMHAKADNPELLEAQNKGLKIYSYPEYLYNLSKNKTRIVVGGSHGKTTITAMVLHVLNYHNIPSDYMVGAQLEGFETMVSITDKNEFIVLEGDEYLSSPIDRTPKFHKYKANVGVISGIAWDHINVFPTEENYIEQFEVFIQNISPGGALIYNREDEKVKKLVEENTTAIKKFSYGLPDYFIRDEEVYIETEEGPLPLQIFGKHNLMNLEAARLICSQMGVQSELFYEAITSFSGASKRLEKIYEKDDLVAFRDFAHAPSKVLGTTDALKEKYSERRLVAVLELHTYSSLNSEFLPQYKNTLNSADKAYVFYSPKSLEIKRLEPVSKEQIKASFNHPNIEVHTSFEELSESIINLDKERTVMSWMSSGNFGGGDILGLISE